MTEQKKRGRPARNTIIDDSVGSKPVFTAPASVAVKDRVLPEVPHIPADIGMGANTTEVMQAAAKTKIITPEAAQLNDYGFPTGSSEITDAHGRVHLLPFTLDDLDALFSRVHNLSGRKPELDRKDMMMRVWNRMGHVVEIKVSGGMPLSKLQTMALEHASSGREYNPIIDGTTSQIDPNHYMAI